MAMLERLTREMELCQDSKLRPASWWMLPPELVKGTMEDLLNPWCGDIGQLPLNDPDRILHVAGTSDHVQKHENFLRQIDYKGCLENISISKLAEIQWRVMDLGSLMDVLLMYAFLDQNPGRLKILEIGGGFGRLAEFIALTHEPGVQYVNIDAVPASLMFCYQYLKHRFPDKIIHLFSPDMDTSTDFDFLIVPSWHLPAFQMSGFDLGINVESMQEMDQGLVDFYLSLLNDRIRENGEIYLVNSRDYKFKGRWSLPDNWECVFRHRTPRSWTIDHPAEVFKQTSSDQKRKNMLRSAAYFQELSTMKAGSKPLILKTA